MSFGMLLMTHDEMLVWLTIWLGSSGILVDILAAATMTSFYKDLVAEGVPNPLLVIYQQTVGYLLPACAEPIGDIVGRKALLSWDIRWLTCGRTMVQITAVDPNDQHVALHLCTPIHLRATENAPQVHLERVHFVPSWNSKRSVPYGRRVICGRLLPPLVKDLYATAWIVVYPKGA